ncbi:interleukin-1 receptor-like 2 isoform X2 [Betta splendens]|uniref:Interleukin-1 receptor-like 2 isoform X2 n=1 Tax=Betta splendens TaxID=158456 RepID=A0A9W2XHG0_BETSP|nr:interleukin-1 receptor-like 2 isoform X2 [Betta splendens]
MWDLCRIRNRTPYHCYRQVTTLVVNVTSQCGRPIKSNQSLTSGVNDRLGCPLNDIIKKLNSYNVTTSLTWYKGCDPIKDGQAKKYFYIATTLLQINRVSVSEDKATFTCTLKFNLSGITGSMSETIDALVNEDYRAPPQMHEPGNEVIKAQLGSSFSKRCLVFVPGSEDVSIAWSDGNKLILNTEPSERIHISETSKRNHDVPKKGVWLEQLLVFSEVTEKDFYINFTCKAPSAYGPLEGYFTLLPADPNIIIPIGSVLGGAMVLFVISIIVYYIFKIEIVLWLRKVFPVLYTNKDLDGRLYDAYVAYPQPGEVGFSKEMETFAHHTLPQVLEHACGYKLFIASRDGPPGQAIIDSVEETIQTSCCLLLLYTASTFTSNQHMSSTGSNNNNFTKSGNTSDNGGRKTNDNDSCTSFNCNEVYPDTRQQLECVVGMHRTLLEGSLKVILVEMEQISPAQLALFPESVRHLRKKQGAVCWWKNTKKQQRWRTCSKSREDEDKCGQDTQWSPSTSPSSRFWKEMRYHMPVRGKREMYPQKAALLNV